MRGWLCTLTPRTPRTTACSFGKAKSSAASGGPSGAVLGGYLAASRTASLPTVSFASPQSCLACRVVPCRNQRGQQGSPTQIRNTILGVRCEAVRSLAYLPTWGAAGAGTSVACTSPALSAYPLAHIHIHTHTCCANCTCRPVACCSLVGRPGAGSPCTCAHLCMYAACVCTRSWLAGDDATCPIRQPTGCRTAARVGSGPWLGLGSIPAPDHRPTDRRLAAGVRPGLLTTNRAQNGRGSLGCSLPLSLSLSLSAFPGFAVYPTSRPHPASPPPPSSGTAVAAEVC